MIAFHGKADPIVPYDYHTKETGGIFSRFVPAPESVRFFADANSCGKTPARTESFDGNIIRETFTGGKDGSEVVFYTVVNGGHAYPGGKLRPVRAAEDQPNRQIKATDLMWEFFKKHSKR